MQRSTTRRTRSLRSSLVARAAGRVVDRLLPKRAAGPSRRGTLESLEARVLMSGNFPSAADNALAYDAGGNLHLAYYDASEHDLKYAVQTPDGAWSREVASAISRTWGGLHATTAQGDARKSLRGRTFPRLLNLAVLRPLRCDLRRKAQCRGGQWAGAWHGSGRRGR